MQTYLRNWFVYFSTVAFFFLALNVTFVPEVNAAPSLNYFWMSPSALSGPGWVTTGWSVSGATGCDMYTTDPTGHWGAHTPNVGVANGGPVRVDRSTTFTLVCTDGVTWPPSQYAASVSVIPLSPVNGVCASMHYNCSAGSLGVTAEYSNQWQWWCNGSSGGSNTLCTEMKPAPTITSFWISPTTISASGGWTTIGWSSNNADSCTVTPSRAGEYSGAGTSGGGPIQVYNTTTYTLQCLSAVGSVSQAVTATVASLAAPANLSVSPAPNFENGMVISWDPVPGAAYYSLRVDNNSDSWQYASGQPNINCNNDPVDVALPPALGGEYNGEYAGIDYCGNVTQTRLSLFVMASSYNNVWVHARGSDNSWGPMARIQSTLPPPSPTIVSASCDASGNARVSWNAIPVPGGLNRHYAFRLDNGRDSWQYDVNNYRTNHDSCVNDSVDASGVRAVPSGAGTDYCGNMTNTSWTGVINPSGTQKAWIHTKSRNFTAFGNLPPSEITFTCSGGVGIPSAPTVSLTAAPNPVAAGGGNTTLNWVVSGATSCMVPVSPVTTGWSGPKAATGGNETIYVGATTTYYLDCTNVTGTTRGQVTVTVPVVSGGPSADLKVNNQDYYGENGLSNPVMVSAGSTVNVTWTSSNVLYCNTWLYNDDAYARGEPANSTLLSSSGISFPAPGSGSWFAQIFCNNTGNPTGGNELVYDQVYISVSSLPPSTLKVCQDNCSGTRYGSGGLAGFTIPSVGSTVRLVACVGTGGMSGSNCDGTDAPTSATWNALNNPDDAVNLSATSGSSTVVSPQSFSGSPRTEQVRASVPTYTDVAVNATVTPPACVPDCSNASNICNEIGFDGGCGANSCSGTRSCDYNWKEVAP